MGSSCCRPEESPQPPQRIIVENSESEEGTLTEFNKGSIQNPEENFQNPAETIPEKGTNQRLSQNSTELVPTDGHETSSGEVQDEFRGEEERVEQSISNGNHYESSGIDEEIPAHVPQSQQQQAEYRRTHTFKLPLYSAGGPKGYAKEHEHIEDPFIAPDIGHAIYLTFHEANRGSLTIQFKKETKDVQGRIIGAGILEADAQGFKYKSATSVATNIWEDSGKFFEGLGTFLKNCYQYQCKVTFYPLPPDFPPFCVAYQFEDGRVYLQYAGEAEVKLSQNCNAAVAVSPSSVKTIQKASRIEYNLFKLQFPDRSRSFVADFAKL